ncbi:hypothetical protein KBC79_04315 [Candidatus Woesebacteria bacterium]|nr:hypothetical protein [Candidatus Woesebacteria bacterium]
MNTHPGPTNASTLDEDTQEGTLHTSVFKPRKPGFSLRRSLRRSFAIAQGLGIKTMALLLFGGVATVYGFQAVLSSNGITLGTKASATQTVEYVASQVVNEDGARFESGDTAWFGNAESGTASYLGLHFQGPTIPSTAQIKNIQLYVYSKQNQWIPISTKIHARTGVTAAQFTVSSRPSQVALSSQFLEYTNNTKWSGNKRYAFPSLLQLAPVLARHEGSFALVLKGTGKAWSRKFIYGASNASRAPRLVITYAVSGGGVPKTSPAPDPGGTSTSPTPVATIQPNPSPITQLPSPSPSSAPRPGEGETGNAGGDSIAMAAWSWTGKNKPDTRFDKCDDGTDVVQAHNQYHVIAYDGIKYPTWHPPVVTNPITSVGKCYFGHEHGNNPEGYLYWSEIHQHFGKDLDGDGVITPIRVSSTGQITPGDRAGLPFGIANEHMAQYYTIPHQGGGFFHRHEDHVGHKVEFVNMESDMVGNTTHTMTQIPGSIGVNVPLYKNGNSNVYYPTGVSCAHLHKFHQGTHAPDAILNNLHETVMHSKCVSSNTDANGNTITNADGTPVMAASRYPNNTVLLTGMMAFGNPGGYKQFCWNRRDKLQCPEGYKSDGSCVISDTLINQLPNSVYSDTLGRNMVDKECLQSLPSQGQDGFYFNGYEIWQGDLRITTADGRMKAEHGRQWDVLDPIRFVDWTAAGNIGYNSMQCGPGGLLYRRTILCEHGGTGEYQNAEWNSPLSNFRGLKRTTYFGRNRISNQGGAEIWWTDPLGSNAVTTPFASGLKQKFSSVEADICKIGGGCTTLNDRAIQRQFSDGGRTVHAPN